MLCYATMAPMCFVFLTRCLSRCRYSPTTQADRRSRRPAHFEHRPRDARDDERDDEHGAAAADDADADEDAAADADAGDADAHDVDHGEQPRDEGRDRTHPQAHAGQLRLLPVVPAADARHRGAHGAQGRRQPPPSVGWRKKASSI
jgi:hypothetical protein